VRERPLRTSVVGSYPAPGWLELATEQLDRFGPADREELQRDAVTAALHDQLAAGLDVVTDGEQSRLDFNLSFYGHLTGLTAREAPRRFGPPGHDQRDRFRIEAELGAPRGLGVVAEFQGLRALAAPGPTLKASVPGPYTLAGRLEPCDAYPDRHAISEALLPIVQKELVDLVAAGCGEICVDEPSMSCYAYREDKPRLVSLFNRTVAPVRGRCRIATHLCFGNYKARAAAPRRYAPMFPEFLELHADEIHVEMASRELSELEIIGQIAARTDVAVGIIDVKSYHVETPEQVAERVRLCLRHAPADRLVFAPDCGLSQTARWAASRKLGNMVEGVRIVRRELGLA
jgi:5-methyltetrahydropteroyltriglutamate--homocysteine methyltransferase